MQVSFLLFNNDNEIEYSGGTANGDDGNTKHAQSRTKNDHPREIWTHVVQLYMYKVRCVYKNFFEPSIVFFTILLKKGHSTQKHIHRWNLLVFYYRGTYYLHYKLIDKEELYHLFHPFSPSPFPL